MPKLKITNLFLFYLIDFSKPRKSNDSKSRTELINVIFGFKMYFLGEGGPE